MKTENSKAIVLSRISYAENDRILTLITPDHGKIRLIAKGVRKVKSKIAGGIELFSTTDITFIKGKSEIGTLVSARLDKHYGNIIKNIERVQLAYEILKQINRFTEDNVDANYYLLLEASLGLLNQEDLSDTSIRMWFEAQLIALAGHQPNLRSESNNKPLEQDLKYTFDIDSMCFRAEENGMYGSGHIKYIRLLFAGPSDIRIFSLEGSTQIETDLRPIITSMFRSYISL